MKLNQNTISLFLLLIIGIGLIVWGIVFLNEPQGKFWLGAGIFLEFFFFVLVGRDIERWFQHEHA